MCQFKIIPIDGSEEAVSLASDEMRQIFDVIARLDSSIVDVLRGDDYAYSFCRMGREKPFWAIYQRSGRVAVRA